MKIHAAFNAAFGNPISVYAAVIDEKLIIAKAAPFNTEKQDNTTLIVNNPLIAADVRFSNDDFQAALQAYQILLSSNQCLIQQDLAQYKLDNVIDYIGQKDNGEEKFNIAELKNGHWAILAICWHFYNHVYTNQKANQAIDFMEDLIDFYDKGSRQNSVDFFATI